MQKKIFSAEIKQFANSIPVSDSSAETTLGGTQLQEILDEIKSLRADLSLAEIDKTTDIKPEDASHKPYVSEELALLKEELEQLSEIILETRREIASLQSTKSGQKFNAMSDQLGAVVGDTENATNAILEAVETIENSNESLELNASTPEETEITEAISNAVMKIYEACNFQDITGQRISKVVGTLTFIDERISKMIEILGGEQELVELEIAEQEVQMDDDIELNGPRAEGQEISQDEIDSLFD